MSADRTPDRKWLDNNLPRYEQCLKKVSDPAQVRTLLAQVSAATLLCSAFGKNDQPTWAVWLIAKVESALQEALTDYTFLIEYEARRASLTDDTHAKQQRVIPSLGLGSAG
jgi:hypothetical protein